MVCFTTKYQILFLLFLLAVSSCKPISHVSIVQEKSIVNRFSNETPNVEPYIAINPTNQKNIVVGSVNLTQNGWECISTISVDGGRTWVESSLNFPDELLMTADPYLAFDNEGNLYYALLGDNGQKINLGITESNDGGFTWATSYFVDVGDKYGFDHSTLAIDNFTSSPFLGNIYLAAHTYFNDNSGQEMVAPFFSNYSKVSNQVNSKLIYNPSRNNLNNGNIVINSNGTIFFFYFVFMDEHRNWLDNHMLYVIQSKDGGHSFSDPILVSDRFTAYFPDAAIDRYSAFKNRIYVTYPYVYGNRISLNYLADGVEEWSKPNQVSDSLAVNPLMSSVAVNKDGIVGVSWFDDRNNIGENCYDIYFSYSTDGGNTFSKDYRISSQSSCPNTPKNAEAFSRFSRGGDYHTLTSDKNGSFYIAWPDARDGIFTTYFAEIKVYP